MFRAFEKTQNEFRRRDRFMRFIVEQNADKVKWCLEEQSVDVNQSHGVLNPLHLAVLTENLHIVRLLVSHGANVNSVDSYNMAPLHYAARRNNVQVASLLLGNGADPNARDAQGKTPLHLAIKSQKQDLVELLLADSEIEINSQDAFGETPLHMSMRNPNYAIIRLLITHNADANLRSSSGRIALEDLVFKMKTDLDLVVKPGHEKQLESCLKMLIRVSSRYNTTQNYSDIPFALGIILNTDLQVELSRNYPCGLKLESYGRVRKCFRSGCRLEESFKKLAVPETLKLFCLLDDL